MGAPPTPQVVTRSKTAGRRRVAERVSASDATPPPGWEWGVVCGPPTQGRVQRPGGGLHSTATPSLGLDRPNWQGWLGAGL